MIAKSHFLNIFLKSNYKFTKFILHHHQNFLLPLPPHHRHLLPRPAALSKSPLNHPRSHRRRNNQFQPLWQAVWIAFLVTPVAFICIIISSPPCTKGEGGLLCSLLNVIFCPTYGLKFIVFE